MLSQGDIVLVPFPFTDEASSKLRPALVVALCERHQDALLAFISSKLNGTPHDDELDILSDQPDFEMSGLKASSRLRLTRMTTLAISLVRRRIGTLPLGVRLQYQLKLFQVFRGG
jgi:mRNA interferase MazF